MCTNEGECSVNKKIITQVRNGEVCIGSIKVNHPEELRKICYKLLESNNQYHNFSVSKSTINLKQSNPFKSPVKCDDKLVYRKNIGMDELGNYGYVRKEVSYSLLNTILLFISLLDNFDFSSCDKYARDFIKNGIIYASSFDEIWNKCSSDMVNKIITETKLCDDMNISSENKIKRIEAKKRDLETFRLALELGLISYDVEQVINDSSPAVFRGCSREDLQQIVINSTVLLGRDDIFRRKKIK